MRPSFEGCNSTLQYVNCHRVQITRHQVRMLAEDMQSCCRMSTSRLLPPKGDGTTPCRAGGVPLSGEPPNSLLQSESRRGVVTCPQSHRSHRPSIGPHYTVLFSMPILLDLCDDIHLCETLARAALGMQHHGTIMARKHVPSDRIRWHRNASPVVIGCLPGCAAWASGQASLTVTGCAPAAAWARHTSAREQF